MGKLSNNPARSNCEVDSTFPGRNSGSLFTSAPFASPFSCLVPSRVVAPLLYLFLRSFDLFFLLFLVSSYCDCLYAVPLPVSFLFAVSRCLLARLFVVSLGLPACIDAQRPV